MCACGVVCGCVVRVGVCMWCCVCVCVLCVVVSCWCVHVVLCVRCVCCGVCVLCVLCGVSVGCVVCCFLCVCVCTCGVGEAWARGKPPCVYVQNASVCTVRTSPCVPATGPNVLDMWRICSMAHIHNTCNIHCLLSFLLDEKHPWQMISQ